MRYSWGAFGGVPERPKGAVCKIAGVAYAGSNPAPPTQRFDQRKRELGLDRKPNFGTPKSADGSSSRAPARMQSDAAMT